MMNKNDLPFYLRKTIQKIFHNLGPGLLGSAYASALCAELEHMGLRFRDDRACINGDPDNKGYDLNILVEEKFRIGIGNCQWRLELQSQLN